jgi:signal transduction histidine kinase
VKSDAAIPAPAAAAELRAARQVRRLLILAVALGFLVLVAMSGLTISLVARDQTFTHWVNHTNQISEQIAALRVNIERTEASQRGYLITGDTTYVDHYRAAANRLPELVEDLRAQTADNPVERRNTASLQNDIALMVAMQQNTMEASHHGGEHADPAALVLADQPLIDRVRNTSVAMIREERRLLEERTSAQAANARVLLSVELVSSILLAAITLLAFLLLRRHAIDLDRSQSALRALNEGLEDAVRVRTRDLTRANEEIQRFAYIVSHDLRSPLVNVMGFTSELEVALQALHRLAERVEADTPELMTAEARAAIEQDLPESIGFIRSSTQKMDRLINAILKLSREGRRTLNSDPLDMNMVLAGVAGSLKHQADDRGATIEIAPDLPALRGDRLAVEQIFGNIVENALKYLKPGRPGHVVVRGRNEGAVNVYEVQDNGRGIAAQDHQRVFELFRRAGTQDQPGEGIGLAHVNALVMRLGGTIGLESELDQGTTFRVSLPITTRRPEDTAV